MSKITTAIKSALGLAIETRDEKRAKLNALIAEREAAAARLAAAKRAELEPFEIAERELAEAERAVKHEEFAEATRAATNARDVLVSRADALARARAALDTAINDYLFAEASSDELFADARSRAAELGQPVPAVARSPARQLGWRQLQTTLFDLRIGPLQFHPDRNLLALIEGPPSELALLAILTDAHGVPNNYEPGSSYTLPERIAHLRKGDVAAYEARLRELAEESRAQSERLRVAYERKQREAQDEVRQRFTGSYMHAPEAE